MDAMHALVIEDDAVTAMMIEDELRDLGFTSVDLAATEEEAIAAVARHRPDLVTSDGSLLNGNGIRAVRKFRATVAVPVIFITGDPERARHCMPGAPLLEKPFTVAQFVAAVELARTALPERR
jgi:DNA-binding response OmpR family regulator